MILYMVITSLRNATARRLDNLVDLRREVCSPLNSILDELCDNWHITVARNELVDYC